jgi:aminoglycoside phosphotransferase (APT) family kinase protein
VEHDANRAAANRCAQGSGLNVKASMHADELPIDEALVRRLLGEQFPTWAGLPLQRIEPSGTVNAIFRLGDELSVRLPRREGPTRPGSKGFEWLPKLAPLLPVEVPSPVAQGRPSSDYPWTGRSTGGLRARRCH